MGRVEERIEIVLGWGKHLSAHRAFLLRGNISPSILRAFSAVSPPLYSNSGHGGHGFPWKQLTLARHMGRIDY